MSFRAWWHRRRTKQLDKAAADDEGAREGREVWETKRLGRQWGTLGSGRRTSYDDGKTRDWN